MAQARVSPGADENPPIGKRPNMSKQATAETVPTPARAHVSVPDQSHVKHVLYAHDSLE